MTTSELSTYTKELAKINQELNSLDLKSSSNDTMSIETKSSTTISTKSFSILKKFPIKQAIISLLFLLIIKPKFILYISKGDEPTIKVSKKKLFIWWIILTIVLYFGWNIIYKNN